jgi:NAD(P)H dehydrogenase (quinone)
MIIVTGATGQLGHAIVEQLLRLHPAAQIGVSVRDPDKAGDLAAQGVRVRHGDFSDAASLDTAFEGATQLLIVSSNAAASGGDPLAQHRNAIDAARKVGVKRIVYTSHAGVGASSKFPPMRDHHATEAMLRDSGMAWTALRNGFYAASGIAMIGDATTSGVILTPQDGPVAWTAHADLAEAAAILLTNEGRFEGPTPPLTGAEALTFDNVAALLSDLAGKPVRHETLSDDAMRSAMIARGTPAPAVPTLLGLFAASRDGEFATVDPALANLLGRRPVSMRDLLAAKFAPNNGQP